MRIEDIRLMYDYTYWASKLICSTAGNLTNEQFWQPQSVSWGSLGGTLIHTMDSEHMWRILLKDRIIAPRFKADDFADLAALRQFWDQEEIAMRGFIDTLSDADLDGVVRYDTPEGPGERIMWHCLWHIVNHGMQHRSEAAVMLTNFGYSPGGLDVTRFLNLRKSGAI